MSCFRVAVKAYVDIESEDATILEIIEKLNLMVCGECTNGEFITFFYAVIDAEKKNITYCNCGHEPTVLLRDGKKYEFEKGGLVLGIDPQTEYEIGTVELKNGDGLIFYTDGLIDSVNYDGDFWGKENMLKTALDFNSASAELMIRNILSYRRRFVGLANQIDDTSIVIVKVDDSLKE